MTPKRSSVLNMPARKPCETLFRFNCTFSTTMCSLIITAVGTRWCCILPMPLVVPLLLSPLSRMCCRLHCARAVAFVTCWGAFDRVVEPVAAWIVHSVMVADAAVAVAADVAGGGLVGELGHLRTWKWSRRWETRSQAQRVSSAREIKPTSEGYLQSAERQAWELSE